jgi:hypothetical protein
MQSGQYSAAYNVTTKQLLQNHFYHWLDILFRPAITKYKLNSW